MIEIAKRISNELSLASYDLLLIGDGSGTLFNKPCGWCCFLYDFVKDTLTQIAGGATIGTNNYSELVPYINALWYDLYQGPKTFPRNVEIVSDSELTVRAGNREYSRSYAEILWASIDKAEALGYNLHWNHIHRNTNEISTECDRIAKELRKICLTMKN